MTAMHLATLAHEDEHGWTRAVVAPGWGGNVVAFAHQRHDWRWPIPVLEPVDPAALAASPTSYGVPVLCPTPGRVGRNQSGRFSFRGREYEMRPARHGFVRGRAWTVDDLGPDRATLSIRITPDGIESSFPFRFTVRQDIAVRSARLEAAIAITNDGDEDQPLDLGLHQYFAIDEQPLATFRAAGLWTLEEGPEATPEALGPLQDDPARGLDLTAYWEHLFRIREDGDTARGAITGERDHLLQDGSAARLAVTRWIEAGTTTASTPTNEERPFTEWQLYTPPGRRAACLEPLSCPPNGADLANRGVDGAHCNVVAPGQTIRFRYAMGLDATEA